MNSKTDYTKLDAAILARIKQDQPAGFNDLIQGAVMDQAKHHESTNHGAQRSVLRGAKPAWRFVDSRLQALRKAGKIRYQRSASKRQQREGWVLCEEGGAA